MSLIKTPKKNGGLRPSILSDFFNTDSIFESDWLDRELTTSVPAVNIKETSKDFGIELSAPGFNKNDFKVNVENGILTVSAEKQNEQKDENERYTRKEFSYSSFSRSFSLPTSVIADKVEAKYENGLLRLSIPKKEETKVLPKKEIQVL